MFDDDKMTYEKRRAKVVYLCDGKDDTCSSCGEAGYCMSMCKHTWNIDHAKKLKKNNEYDYRLKKLMKFELVNNELFDEYGRPNTFYGVWEVEDE